MRQFLTPFLLGAVVLNLIWQPIRAGVSNAEATDQPRTITVSGNAEVKVVPDEIRLTFGVESWNKDLKTARRENDEKIRRVLALLREQGIDPKQIQTDYLNVEPRFEDYYTHSTLQGYLARKTVTVTLKDVSKFENVLAGVFDAGANYVYGVEFHTTELRKHRDEARALAVRAAREKAAAMAKELGQEIGEPLTVREEGSTDWGWYRWWWGGGTSAQNVIQNAGGGGAAMDGSVALGQIPVNANVSIEFALK